MHRIMTQTCSAEGCTDTPACGAAKVSDIISQCKYKENIGHCSKDDSIDKSVAASVVEIDWAVKNN